MNVCCSSSTLRASFEQLKTQIENIGNFHIQLSDILKEEVKKIESFRERQKEQRKKFESIMEKVQKKKVSFFKKTMESKKNYEVKCKEADEAEQGAEKTNATSKNPEKVKTKYKLSDSLRNAPQNVQMPTGSSIYELQVSSCQLFQQLEGNRISMLRCALWDHCNHFSMQCVKDDESYEEVRKFLEQCDITKDNNSFIEMKGTGLKAPEPIVFESYYKTGTVRDNNGQAHFAGGGEDPSKRCSDPLLGSSLNTGMDSPLSPRSTLSSIGEFQLSDDGYAPLPCIHQEVPLSTGPPDEIFYVVLYQYTAKEEDELSVSRGDVVRVLDQEQNGWWTVERNGFSGLVPGNYLGQI
ncbi:proline-serine-threonine phosphatase-interacting protein 1-like [Neolamprologus brichardi]|uniref:proline-serine-threonine phosphatase-interacting protein 1-like n=1 Tax=Neolamprologus brichardi TaxID=32507 RepID=UPI001643B479|nr:proline-serine-threonine phosphatase-interacting protein 1-like [Neolamprologus brichardi]